ncbi:solute carrier family 35 member B1 homolog [Condylostylus longicornis]|uniref:solute carrier family 35 member B1 homolog n=1 Tax=Condylostylus longicornis TaxID=2530218 RepID=UPI00244DE272|nr:solute carrier family 35 member B1 homolog [Condylostylus longicornis]
MLPEKSRFIVYALGIFFCYFYYGIIQEKVTRGRYGTQINPDGTIGERFTLTLALVWVQCICNWLFAKAMLFVKPQKEDTTHSGYYATCALTYLLGFVSSNMALRWVPYPTQVVGKSAKPIPVMILAVLVGKKSYPWLKYFCVLIIVTGVVMFMYIDGKSSKQINEDKVAIGELLLLMSLSMDGMTGAVQERMRASSAPSGQQMMLAMNWWSALILGAALIFTGEGKDFAAFAVRHPNMLVHLGTLALAGALGQLFIFLMVSCFGPLSCSVVTTTRKFFTVLCSVILFGNVLSMRQWFGAVLVFAGLFADMFLGKKSHSHIKPLPNNKSLKNGDEKNKLLS